MLPVINILTTCHGGKKIIVERKSGSYSGWRGRLFILSPILDKRHRAKYNTDNRNGPHWALVDQRPFSRVNYFGFLSLFLLQ